VGQINEIIKDVSNPTTKTKLVELKEDGEVVDRTLVTTVSFDYEGTPGNMDKVLWALKNGQRVDIAFSSPQGTFESVLDSTGKKSKLNKETGELVESS
jgi:putative NADH-flavin reductase